MKNFSVLLPIYDRQFLKTTICDCLDSIYANSTLPSEVVLVCDGPLSWDIERQLSKKTYLSNIKFIHLEKNMGLSAALNIGLQACENDIVARVDADDFCCPERFELQIELINQGYNLVGSNIQEVDENGNELGQRKVPERKPDIIQFAIRRNPFNHMTLMYSKRLVAKSGGYPEFYLKEDYALWTSMLTDDEVMPYNIQKPLMYATAGTKMYARRSSVKILSQEYKMQRLLHSKLKKRLSLCFFDFLIRTGFFFLPIIGKSAFYDAFLREK